MPNFWIILFTATASQGFFLGLALGLKERWKNKSVNLLSLLILSFTVTLTYYLAFWLGYTPNLPGFTSLILQFTLLFGPLLWLYINAVQKKKARNTWLHFLPFVLSIVLLSFPILPLSQREVNGGIIIFQSVQLVAYSILLIWKVKKTALKLLTYAFTGYSACFLSYYILAWTGLLQIQYDYIVSLGMSIFIYYLGYKGLQTKPLIPVEKTEKYSNSTLTNNALSYIIDKLDQIMAKEKLYVNGDLKLQELADRLDVSIHSLSQAINSGKDQKFNEYVNELRIQEAKRLMSSESHQNLKLIAIALDSGFNNKTSFLNAFKKHTGQSPSEYREKLLAQAS